jgi:hypothetical protein
MSSLTVIGRLFLPYRGDINDIGFCSGSDQAISHRPPRPESVPYDFWCSDRFLSFGRDETSSSVGSVEVSEALVYDNRMHGEIDFTGFSVRVSLQGHAYQAYLDYIGEVRIELRDPDAWDRRIPSHPFAAVRVSVAARQFYPVGDEEAGCRPIEVDQTIRLRRDRNPGASRRAGPQGEDRRRRGRRAVWLAASLIPTGKCSRLFIET